jgi:hypothetical protein
MRIGPQRGRILRVGYPMEIPVVVVVGAQKMKSKSLGWVDKKIGHLNFFLFGRKKK